MRNNKHQGQPAELAPGIFVDWNKLPVVQSPPVQPAPESQPANWQAGLGQDPYYQQHGPNNGQPQGQYWGGQQAPSGWNGHSGSGPQHNSGYPPPAGGPAPGWGGPQQYHGQPQPALAPAPAPAPAPVWSRPAASFGGGSRAYDLDGFVTGRPAGGRESAKKTRSLPFGPKSLLRAAWAHKRVSGVLAATALVGGALLYNGSIETMEEAEFKEGGIVPSAAFPDYAAADVEHTDVVKFNIVDNSLSKVFALDANGAPTAEVVGVSMGVEAEFDKDKLEAVDPSAVDDAGNPTIDAFDFLAFMCKYPDADNPENPYIASLHASAKDVLVRLTDEVFENPEEYLGAGMASAITPERVENRYKIKPLGPEEPTPRKDLSLHVIGADGKPKPLECKE